MKKVLSLLGNIAVFREISRSKMPFYAVAAGWETGVYNSWPVCEQKVKGFSKPKFKKFQTLGDAEQFVKAHKPNSSTSSAFDPKGVAIPLGSNKDAIEIKSEPIVSEIKNKPNDFGSASEAKDNWPDDIAFDEGDNDVLLKAMEEVEGISGGSRKRKIAVMGDIDVSCGVSYVAKRSVHVSRVWQPIGLKRIGKFEFPIDSEGYVLVYTDGSCINNGQTDAVAGFGVYFSQGHALNTAQPVQGRVTNNSGEIQAAIYAIRVAKDFGIQKLCLSTDSQFLIKAVTLWMKGWKRKGWKLKNGDPVKNVDDFKILDEILDGSIDVKWNYVKGHEGIEGNEMADQLARKGSDLYRQKMLAVKRRK